MVREIGGDSNAPWQKPIQKTPEPPPIGPFDKKHAHAWIKNVQAYLQWGFDNWDNPDVRGQVTKTINDIDKGIFNDDDYEMSTEILREGLKIPFTSKRFGHLQMFVIQMRDFPNVDTKNPNQQKEALEEILTSLDQIMQR